jgi:hypothetical protein
MSYRDERTGLLFDSQKAAERYFKKYPAPIMQQVGDQIWMSRKTGDTRELSNIEKAAEIEATKRRYTSDEIKYLSSTDAIAEYIKAPLIFLARWARV